MMQKRIILFLVLVVFAIASCLGSLTVRQQAEFVYMEAKKAEKYYENVAFLYGEIYNDYKSNPTDQEKIKKLKEMRKIHDDVKIAYDEFREADIALKEALENTETDDELLQELMDKLLDYSTKLIIKATL